MGDSNFHWEHKEAESRETEIQREHERQQKEADRRHERLMSELQNQAANVANSAGGSNSTPAPTATHRLQLFKYEEGQDTEPDIETFQMVDDNYQLEEAIKRLGFMNLFERKALSILHWLEPSTRDYGSMNVEFFTAVIHHEGGRLQESVSTRLVAFLDKWIPKTLEGFEDLLVCMQMKGPALQSCWHNSRPTR